MTLQEFQDRLHELFIGSGSTPSDGSDEWNHREILLEAGINIWDGELPEWNELWTTLADASSGDKTVNASDQEYDMPSDFRRLGAWVRVTNAGDDNTYYSIISPQQAEKYKNTTAKACYITGNKSAGYVLNFLEQPTAGDTINYPYYKEPTAPTSTTDVIEMNDSWFTIYYSLGRLHEREGNGDQAQSAYAIADRKLSMMKRVNMSNAYGQENKVPDRDFMRGIGGFGSNGAWGVSRYGDQL